MSKTSRRRERRPRPRVEALEARALLANAGTPDPTFGGGTGYASFPLSVPSLVSNFSPGNVTNSSSITLPNGNIVVTGIINSNTGPAFSSVLSIAEFNADGSIDTGFGIGGQEQLPVVRSYALQALASGQFLLAEGLDPELPTYAAVRLNANGAVDSTFGVDGVAQYPADSMTPTADRLGSVSSILLLSGGQILLAGAAGAAGGDFAAVRLNADGSLDTTYGTNGTADVPVTVNGHTGGGASFAALQTNGQILLAGTVETGFINDGMTVSEQTEGAVLRLNTDGSLDTTYGGPTVPGVALLPYNLSSPTTLTQTTPAGFAIDPTTGQAIVSEFTQQVEPAGPTLYRLNTDGSIDTSFGTGGEVTPIGAGPVAVQANGQILVASFYSDYSNLVRLNADGTPDATFGNSPAPGVFQPKLPNLNTTGNLTLQSNGDILLSGIGSTPSLSGRVFTLSVAQVLASATTGASATPIPSLPADFNGAGYTDPAVYDPTTSSFVFYTPGTPAGIGPDTFQFGISGVGQTIPAAADYLGNGTTQFAAYLPASGVYAILPTNGMYGLEQIGPLGSPGLFMPFGMAGAGNSIPVPADYYGTGQADVAVYMPSIASFAILAPGNATGKIVPFGTAGAGQSIPAPADYYGTGQDDIAVYLAQSGVFAIQDPTGQTPGMLVPFGKPGLGQSIPVPGDYDGSGKTELAVYVPSVGAYFYRPANGGPDVIVPIGIPNAGYIPVPGDYDGSGRTEAAIYDPTTGVILYQPANGGPAVGMFVGTANNGSIPVAAPAGSLPEFAPPGGGGGGNAIRIRADNLPSNPTGSGSPSPAAFTLSSASTVPAGPTLASIRVPRTLVNQEAPDPLTPG